MTELMGEGIHPDVAARVRQAADALAAAQRPQEADYAAIMARAEHNSVRMAARDEAAREVPKVQF